MRGPCQCGNELPGQRPSVEQLTAALAKVLVEIDAYRMMLDLPTYEARRSFSCQELDEAAKIGLVVRKEAGGIICWPES